MKWAFSFLFPNTVLTYFQSDQSAVQLSLKLVEALFVRAQARFIGDGDICIALPSDNHLAAAFQHVEAKAKIPAMSLKADCLS